MLVWYAPAHVVVDHARIFLSLVTPEYHAVRLRVGAVSAPL